MCWLHIPVTHANYGCLVTWFILSTSFVSAILIIFVGWVIGLFRPFRYFVSAALFVLFMLVGIFEPNRSFVTSNRSFGLLDANLHHLTPFYLFDHLCQMAPLC